MKTSIKLQEAFKLTHDCHPESQQDITRCTISKENARALGFTTTVDKNDGNIIMQYDWRDVFVVDTLVTNPDTWIITFTFDYIPKQNSLNISNTAYIMQWLVISLFNPTFDGEELTFTNNDGEPVRVYFSDMNPSIVVEIGEYNEDSDEPFDDDNQFYVFMPTTDDMDDDDDIKETDTIEYITTKATPRQLATYLTKKVEYIQALANRQI